MRPPPPSSQLLYKEAKGFCKLPLLYSSSFSCLLNLFPVKFLVVLQVFASMSFFIEDSSVIVTHLLYKAALIIAVLRWVLSWALRVRNRTLLSEIEHPPTASSSSSSSCVSSQTIRDSLILTTFGDITERLRESCDTCAVCLSQLREGDEVRELRNCCHVFHRECIDRWVDHDHDNHKSCPLCRAPLLRDSQSLSWARSEPSWAVERLLYLFGDDLLI